MSSCCLWFISDIICLEFYRLKISQKFCETTQLWGVCITASNVAKSATKIQRTDLIQYSNPYGKESKCPVFLQIRKIEASHVNTLFLENSLLGAIRYFVMSFTRKAAIYVTTICPMWITSGLSARIIRHVAGPLSKRAARFYNWFIFNSCLLINFVYWHNSHEK